MISSSPNLMKAPNSSRHCVPDAFGQRFPELRDGPSAVEPKLVPRKRRANFTPDLHEDFEHDKPLANLGKARYQLKKAFDALTKPVPQSQPSSNDKSAFDYAPAAIAVEKALGIIQQTFSEHATKAYRDEITGDVKNDYAGMFIALASICKNIDDIQLPSSTSATVTLPGTYLQGAPSFLRELKESVQLIADEVKEQHLWLKKKFHMGLGKPKSKRRKTGTKTGGPSATRPRVRRSNPISGLLRAVTRKGRKYAENIGTALRKVVNFGCLSNNDHDLNMAYDAVGKAASKFKRHHGEDSDGAKSILKQFASAEQRLLQAA